MTKDELKRYRRIKEEIRQIEEKIDECQVFLHSPSFEAMPKGSPDASPVERLTERKLQLENRYAEKLDTLVREQIKIEKAIDSLDGVERMLMRYRYIDGRPWEEIAYLLGYEWAQTHRLHASALLKLKEEE